MHILRGLHFHYTYFHAAIILKCTVLKIFFILVMDIRQVFSGVALDILSSTGTSLLHEIITVYMVLHLALSVPCHMGRVSNNSNPSLPKNM